MMTAELPKSYAPAASEAEIRARWDAKRPFHTTPDAPGEPYCILIPPPNVTAALHLGHAFNNTLQDVLARAHRMGIGGRQYNVLWMPGTDHAGIATQTVVEKRLLQQGIKRREMKREDFVARVQEWKDEYEATIIEQLKAMGCSCDWDRVRFTMDPMCAKAVREAFFRLFKAGLIYRGKRLVNWDPVTLTALADDEVEMKEVRGHMWYLRYPLEDGSGHVTVATTRPETMLGDTAVAINPKDPRAASLRGKKVRLPIVDRVVPIIEDDYVVLPLTSRDRKGADEGPTSRDRQGADAKAEFATGFLKVTPAHDPNDWEIGLRHGLPVINILSPEATISDQHGWNDVSDEARLMVGLSREDARKAVVKWFKEHGLLEEMRDYTHSVGHSYRSHVPIEPYLSDQWYVKVTDDSWSGEALRALADEQYEGQKPTRSVGAGGTGVPPVRVSDESQSGSTATSSIHKPITQELLIRRRSLPHWQMGGSTYFVTFRLRVGQLSEAERRLVLDACLHWHGQRTHVHLATVMPDHVHLLMTPLPRNREEWYSLSEILHSIKGFTAHRINEMRGTTGSLWQDESFDRIVRDDDEFFEKWNYMAQNPVKAGLVASPEEYAFTARGGNEDSHRRDACATAPGMETRTGGTPVPPGSSRTGDNGLRFFPARYAKSYQAWHDPRTIRDWCISRQLWWGHRIPVWHKQATLTEKNWPDELLLWGWDDFVEGNWDGNSVHVRIVNKATGAVIDPTDDPLMPVVADTEGDYDIFVCLGDDSDWAASFVEAGFTQDPDVLDTWFSSGLWPLSTMGWPDPSAYPETNGLLDTFNPSTVLVTARDIITLWVSRMVMFNRYLRDGVLPFRHVYINPLIQDGHGQRMAKSLGNGVDPRDIIHTHGADALRFILCQKATETQDVRLAVDVICPQCEHEFNPTVITSPEGYRVADAIQVCPACGKEMVSLYGSASGRGEITRDRPLARNSSNEFDLGRNFANKLWNATRFALGNLTAGEVEASPREQWAERLTLADRWIITRLHRTLHTVEDALKEYRFSIYAEAMYDFIWRDFCDWYLEAIKPTVKDNPVQQQVLRTVLNAALRMLHPICPFVTEALWPHVTAAGEPGLDGIELPPSELLAVATWPDIACKVDDTEAAASFERARALTELIRSVRGEKSIPNKARLSLLVTPPVQPLIDAADGLVQTIAGLDRISVTSEHPKDAIPLTFEGEHLFLTGLSGAVDRTQERLRLQKVVQDLQKSVAGFRNKLHNEDYVRKAPAAVVEETRQRYARAEAELAAAAQALEALGG